MTLVKELGGGGGCNKEKGYSSTQRLQWSGMLSPLQMMLDADPLSKALCTSSHITPNN
jgi:hypothetical protein